MSLPVVSIVHPVFESDHQMIFCGKANLGTLESLVPIYNAKDIGDVGTQFNHWFGLTFMRDGFNVPRFQFEIDTSDGELRVSFYIENDGTDAETTDLKKYLDRLPRFVQIGQDALQIVNQIRQTPVWDPLDEGWKFMLPMGMPMIRQKSVQFFHFPPLRLADTTKDYLCDPVPSRWGELLRANGLDGGNLEPTTQKRGDLPEEMWPSCPLTDPAYLYETIVDSIPIAAPDSAGVRIAKTPFDAFHKYQRDMLELLLNDYDDECTIPIAVYGIQPMAKFESTFGANLDFLVTQTLGPAKNTKHSDTSIKPGKHTAVLGVTHPYRWYVAAQLDNSGGTIGDGKLGRNCQLAKELMVLDLIAARWQMQMAADPRRYKDSHNLIDECTAYWNDPAQQETICAMVRHQGTMYTDSAGVGAFGFRTSYSRAKSECQSHQNQPCGQ